MLFSNCGTLETSQHKKSLNLHKNQPNIKKIKMKIQDQHLVTLRTTEGCKLLFCYRVHSSLFQEYVL